jgi:hypothetical protein
MILKNLGFSEKTDLSQNTPLFSEYPTFLEKTYDLKNAPRSVEFRKFDGL